MSDPRRKRSVLKIRKEKIRKRRIRPNRSPKRRINSTLHPMQSRTKRQKERKTPRKIPKRDQQLRKERTQHSRLLMSMSSSERNFQLQQRRRRNANGRRDGKETKTLILSHPRSRRTIRKSGTRRAIMSATLTHHPMHHLPSNIRMLRMMLDGSQRAVTRATIRTANGIEMAKAMHHLNHPLIPKMVNPNRERMTISKRARRRRGGKRNLLFPNPNLCPVPMSAARVPRASHQNNHRHGSRDHNVVLPICGLFGINRIQCSFQNMPTIPLLFLLAIPRPFSPISFCPKIAIL